MNVIVSNKQKDIIDNVNIDAIKDLNGLFTIDDLLSKFKNYFFSKMILDATSIINFSSKEVLEKLATEIGGERLIILLPPSPEPPQEFINKLIDLKIYNFSTNINDVVRFLTNPNTADTFANRMYGNDEQIYVDNSIRPNNGFNDTMGFNQGMNNGFPNNNYSNNNTFNGIVSPTTQYSIPQDSFGNGQDTMQNQPMNNQSMPVGIPQTNNNQNIPVGIPQTSNNQNIPVGIPQTSNNQNIPVGIPQTSNNQNIPVGIPQTSNNQNIPVGIPQTSNNQNIPVGMPQGFNNAMPQMPNNQGMPFNNQQSGFNSNPMMNNMMPQNNMGQYNNNYNPLEGNVSNQMSYTQNTMNYQNQMNNVQSSGIYNGDKKVFGIKNITPHAGSTTLTYMLVKEVRGKLNEKVLGIEVDKHDFFYFQDRRDLVSVDSANLLNEVSKSTADVIFIDLNKHADFSICDEVIFLIEPSTIKLNMLVSKDRIVFKALANKKVILNKSMLSNSDVRILSSEAGISFLMNIPPLNERESNKIILELYDKLK